MVNPIVGTSVASIINKHADYAACGKPVINTQVSREYRDLIAKYKMGFNCDSIVELSDYLKMLYDDVSLRKTMGEKARICSEELFDRKVSYKRLIDVILRE